MNRRSFLQACSGILASIGISTPTIARAYSKEKYVFSTICTENTVADEADLSLRFLGTGASGWYQDKTRRRHSSVLLDKKILIDFNKCCLDMLPEGVFPQTIFYTHSHGDHFEPLTALQLGIKKVYLGKTWYSRAIATFKKLALKHNLPMPKIIPLEVGQKVVEEGLVFTALPANHATSDLKEQALIYLIEKGSTKEKLGVRLLYATDTGGILGIASRLAGIDSHLNPGRPITGFIMEASIGMGMEEDYRIFNHSTVAEVARTVHMLEKTGRYQPLKNQPAYITHMSRTGWPATQEELNEKLPYPLRASYDGLDVVFRSR